MTKRKKSKTKKKPCCVRRPSKTYKIIHLLKMYKKRGQGLKLSGEGKKKIYY